MINNGEDVFDVSSVMEVLCTDTSSHRNLILIGLMDYYEDGCNSISAEHRVHQCTFIHWLVNSGAICSVLCWPYSSWAPNGRHGTDNGNGIRRRGNGRQRDSLHLSKCMPGFVCLDVWVRVSTGACGVARGQRHTFPPRCSPHVQKHTVLLHRG